MVDNMKKSKKIKILLVTVVFLLAVFSGLFVYAYFNGRSGLHPNPNSSVGDVRIACIGDSITYGSTVKNWPKNNYPVILGNMLGDGYTVCNYGISGGTLLNSADKPYMQTEMFSASVDFLPDVVVLMLGTNDSKQDNWTNEIDFYDQLNAFIDEYESLSSKPSIILCTPCKAYSDIYTIQDTVVFKVAEITKRTASERGLALVDIHAISEHHPEWFETDGVHPNNDGAAAIAEAVYQAILSIEVKE